MPDKLLVKHAKNGDTEATEYLLRKYKSVVLFKSRSYFLHGADRDDMIQEGMIGLFKAIRDFRPDRSASFKTFVDVCVTRQMITAVKSGAGQRQLPIIYAGSLSPGDSCEDRDEHQLEVAAEGEAIDPQKILIARESVRELGAVLRETLSEFEWNVFVAFAEGKSYQEIAKEQGQSPKSIDNALCRVRRKLNKWRAEQKLQERSDIPALSQNQKISIQKACVKKEQDENQKPEGNNGPLTKFEKWVYNYHLRGLSPQEIAEVLGYKRGRIEFTLDNIDAKLGGDGKSRRPQAINGRPFSDLERQALAGRLEGLTNPEIAERLGDTPKRIKNAFHRARAKLKNPKLEDKGQLFSQLQSQVLLYHLDGLPKSEIAKKLGRRCDGVAGALNRAYTRLKNSITNNPT